MKNDELLKKYAGISTRIRRTFAYHYDQIQREVQTEISTLDPNHIHPRNTHRTKQKSPNHITLISLS